MAATAANSNDPHAVNEFAGQDLDAGTVRQLKTLSRQGSLYGSRHVFIINEAHTIPVGGMDRFLEVLEDVGDSCWFFTTTEDVKFFTPAFISRVNLVEFAHQGMCAAAVPWLINIAQKEGLKMSASKAKKIVRDGQNNLRYAIGVVQKLCKNMRLSRASAEPRLAEMQPA